MAQFLKVFRKKLGRVKRWTHSRYCETISCFIDFYYTQRNVLIHNDKKIFIAITTTKNYAAKTIPTLIKNLESVGIPKDLIHIFEGGHTLNSSIMVNGYHYHFINNNSFDITALIGIVELDLPHEYWLLLHDTVYLKKSFKNLLFSCNPTGYECMPLKTSPAMNIGIYSKSYLLRNRTYLSEFSNKNYSTVGLITIKRKAFEEEDFLFNSAEKIMYLHTKLSKYEYTKNIQYHNSPRLMEGYPQLGLIKYKANFSLKNEWRITL